MPVTEHNSMPGMVNILTLQKDGFTAQLSTKTELPSLK
jgi:hypothetical protein